MGSCVRPMFVNFPVPEHADIVCVHFVTVAMLWSQGSCRLEGISVVFIDREGKGRKRSQVLLQEGG